MEGFRVEPMVLDSHPRAGRAGTIHIRHSTDNNDMNKLETMTACGRFDGAIIVTFICMGNTPQVSTMDRV
jgi:hypothetical protein